MITLDGHTLPWYLIGVLITALLAVFYAVLRGKLLAARTAELLRESAEKRNQHLEAAAEADRETIKQLVEAVGKLLIYAENADKVLKILADRSSRSRG